MGLRSTCVLLAAACAGHLPIARAALQIVPGATLTASNGAHMQAHGGGVIEVNGTYYLIGEDKTDGSVFQNVNCYSSRDLVQWHYEGALLSRTGSGDLGPNRVIERPKVIYNDKTQKYVLWMHVDSSNYGEAKTGVATGDTVCGKYTYHNSFQPLGFQSRDMGLFKDDDGKAYLLSEDRANGLRIMRLSDDYLSVAASTYLWKDHIEAPALIKIKGRYYMFGSHLSGWDPNDNVVSTSTSLTSGWSSWATFADKNSKTYSSQTHYVLPYGSSGNVMYMGDRWVSKNLRASTYVWLPLTISGTTVTMKNHAAWLPNVESNQPWASHPDEKSYAGNQGAYGGGAKAVDCKPCSGGKAAGYVGGPSHGTITLSGLSAPSSGTTTLIVRYGVSEAGGRQADVRINGGSTVRMDFLPGAQSDNIGESVLTTALKSGSNTVEFAGVGDAWGPDIDIVEVPSA
ncbi:glycosyl hydrolase family 43 protein [Sporothrix brasiliensis 5110]|uniref:Glycosyl hydrolase family 43 protein n=1 Tax=Sporothrix brasiliensis 5110 TaxID=1398154 RepID=A0A0C2IIQ4_9PEZI|nr:glycosyl hydrolase family 43 protein [Sporothrix brasiliensis 5110]KIH89056.1 glycosyl hydrolase family 43 protein [Sporothrix brasiliensis 5110]